MSTSTVIPEGWMVERGDPSVGIFGDSFWHDNCLPDIFPQEAVVTEVHAGYRGEGYKRTAITVVGLQCPSCGASVTFQREDYDPDDTEDEGR